MSEWVRAFPDAAVMCYGGDAAFGTAAARKATAWRLPNDCRAEFTDCDSANGVGHHTCMPGPVNRFAEAMVAEALTKLTNKANTTAHKR